MSLELLIWKGFSFLVLSINKTFSKGCIIPPLKLTIYYIVLKYCKLDTTCLIYA